MRHSKVPQYIEPVPILEEIATAPAMIEVIGNGMFIVLYVDHVAPPELEQGIVRRICLRPVLPRDGAEKLRRMLDEALSREPTPNSVEASAAEIEQRH